MIKLSQTAIKDLENDATCPLRWKTQWLDKKIEFTASEAMNMGKYFEYLCLGKGAIEGEDVTDLPRGKTGAKGVDQVRIEEQAKLFLERFNPESDKFLGFTIIDRQPILEYLEGDKPHRGVIDFVCVDKDGKKSIWDLKFTQKIKGFGKYDWSTPEKMDFFQQVFYEWLWYNNCDEILPSYIYVADSSPDMESRIYHIDISDYQREQTIHRTNQVWRAIGNYTVEGWGINPSKPECLKCPLKCEHRFVKPLIEQVIF